MMLTVSASFEEPSKACRVPLTYRVGNFGIAGKMLYSFMKGYSDGPRQMAPNSLPIKVESRNYF